jgi:hypothetical protein
MTTTAAAAEAAAPAPVVVVVVVMMMMMIICVKMACVYNPTSTQELDHYGGFCYYWCRIFGFN